MSNEAYPTGPAPSPGRVEEKTKVGAYATYAGALILFAVLTNTATDLTFLPDWLETIVLPLVPAIASLLGSYLKNHKPGRMSRSAVVAVNRTS
jgi:hypothetical protein